MKYVTVSETLLEDAPVIAGIIRESFRDVAEEFGLTPENCPSHPSNCTVEWVEAAFAKGAKFFLLIDKDQPCGCVAMNQIDPDMCSLEHLAVLPGHRNKGHGSVLVQTIFLEARLLGAKRVEIAIIAENEDLKEWYEERGFVPTGTERFDHLPFEVMFMTADISGFNNWYLSEQ